MPCSRLVTAAESSKNTQATVPCRQLCILTLLVSRALADNAFEAGYTSTGQTFRAEPLERGFDYVPLLWKSNMRKRYVVPISYNTTEVFGTAPCLYQDFMTRTLCHDVASYTWRGEIRAPGCRHRLASIGRPCRLQPRSSHVCNARCWVCCVGRATLCPFQLLWSRDLGSEKRVKVECFHRET